MREQGAPRLSLLRGLPGACAGALLGLALVPQDASAYIDPGLGSMIIQGLIAAVVGSGVALRLRWRQIKARLSGGARSRKDADEAADDAGGEEAGGRR